MFQGSAGHAVEGAEMQIVGAGRVSGGAVDLGFEGGVVGLDEPAGGGATLRVGHAGDAAIRAEAAGGCGADLDAVDGGQGAGFSMA